MQLKVLVLFLNKIYKKNLWPFMSKLIDFDVYLYPLSKNKFKYYEIRVIVLQIDNSLFDLLIKIFF